MVRKVIIGVCVGAALALSGCAGAQAGLRADDALANSQAHEAGTDAPVAVNGRASFEAAESSGGYAGSTAATRTSDSQDPIPITPNPTAMQNGDGSGHYRLHGDSPVASQIP
ncbi:MAG: hypothetical protein JST54_02860 [Deltaproteobacteria bacterium]|nr:hypothetical protein [Deltaproteobacteria bacterium]